MASFVQGKLKKVKPTSKNVTEKYKEVLEQTLKEVKKPDDLKIGLETFIGAGKHPSCPPLLAQFNILIY